ncbi:MAG: hypothetical protein A4E63_00137 [Syntrophorhabdus sp. PtaU1.Bin050]|nr:MAG: hypothetical protein A4E63_00137 [Syntrophorhabdus sp. PtaU1.Bin050]
MLHNRTGRLLGKEFQYIEAVVDIRQINLTWMFPDLQHVFFRNPTHQAILKIKETNIPEDNVPIHQLVDR